MPTVAELIVEALVEVGVKRVYGVAGDSLNSIVDGVRRHEGITWVQVRHEEVGAYAAAAEAQLTGQLSVCAGSCGPGNLHLMNGLYDAHRSMAPVLAIAAHIPSSEIGTNYFQETHPERLFVECSHFCEFLSTPRQLPRILQIAMHTALSRRGVSVLVIPGDVAMEDVPEDKSRHDFAHMRPLVRPPEHDLDELAGLLNESKKVTFLCGSGCGTAHDQVMKLATLLQAPIVHALRGKEHVEHDNPNDVGMTGLIGFTSGYRAIEACDLLLMLGTDFPYQQFYPKKARIIQIDVRAENLGRRSRLDLGLVGDVNETLLALMPKIEQKADSSFLKEALEDYATTRKELDSHAKGLAGHTPIHPEYLAALINELASDNAIFTCDTGMCTVWAARYLRMTRDRRLLGSFNHGSMANAMPHAVGAQFAQPGRQVVALCGDGGFSMLMGDILTVRQYELPIKLIIFNNSCLGMVKLEMQVAGLPNSGTDYKPIVNYARIAEAAGILGMRIEDPAGLPSAIKQVMEHQGPALLDVVTNPYELIKPPNLKLSQAWGFSLFMLKETLFGNASNATELIKSNLR
jgi:pyruvate dehydrogenase (quinone)